MAKRGQTEAGIVVGEELATRLGERIVKGWSIASAAEAEGIARRRIYSWLEKGEGEKAEEPYTSFAHTLKRYLAEARGNAEARIYRGDLRWESSARWLESLDPETWRRTERREVTQTHDVRFSWPDLAKPGKTMASQRAAAVDEALKAGKA